MRKRVKCMRLQVFVLNVNCLWCEIFLSRLPLEGSRSAVWQHFGFPSKDGKIITDKMKRDKVHCKICSAIIKYCGSTTNLRFHLKEHYPSIFKSHPSSSSNTREQRPQGQSTLPQVLSATQPIPTSCPKSGLPWFRIQLPSSSLEDFSRVWIGYVRPGLGWELSNPPLHV